MSNRQRLPITVFILLASCAFGRAISVTLADTPRLTSATPLSQTAVQLRFDQTLDPSSAENLSNYRIEPEIEVEWATLDSRMDIVHLYTSPLEINKRYTVKVEGVVDAKEEVFITLPETMEITFGEGQEVTFSGVTRDTTLIVHPQKKERNYNAGGEEFLLCTPIGGIFFVAFDIMEAFEEIGITRESRILDASISLYAESVGDDSSQQVIIRRVLLPWHEGAQKSQPAKENELTYNSAMHQNFPWNKPPAQAMLEGVNGEHPSDYNGSEDVAYRIDGLTEIGAAGTRYIWQGNLVTDAARFWLANPDYSYGYLFALRDGTASVRFSSKEHPDETRRPVLTIRYRTQVENSD
ncbi:hypothetical protein C6502_15855 [Candidatus Poribacteria bacterium]|nr:MAG: hypothetical protein C6502_15855 [Candidatus Poribacteria bacterium]